MNMSQSLKSRFDFSKTESQSFTIHSVRLAFLLLVLLFVLSFQFLEARIDAGAVLYPLYVLISFSMMIQVGFFSFFKKLFFLILILAI